MLLTYSHLQTSSTAARKKLTRHRLSHLHILSGGHLSISRGGRGEVGLLGRHHTLFFQLAMLVLPVGAVRHAVLHQGACGVRGVCCVARPESINDCGA